MPRVLIITYYWPPSGGSAVLRWLKFAKYLRDFGWEPVIYTPANPEPQEIDTSLLKDIPENMEVIKSPIWEPYNIYKRLTGKKKEDRLGVALMSDKKQGFVSRLLLWIRSNLFIPDPRRFWVRPSVRLLSRYLHLRPVDVIVTTGPPHSMHLIGLGLKRRLGIKWVADFRDPWTNIDFYRDLALTRWADCCHKRLERKVLHGADRVITVSPGMTREFASMGISRIATITNGFDVVPASLTKPLPEKFTLLHLGSIPKSRNPENLWQVLADLVGKNPGFAGKLQIKLIGKTDRIVQESIGRYDLQDFVLCEDFIPHEKTFQELTEAAVLLLFINNTPNAGGILTNKFFEYLSARRPILAIGPVGGDASVILGETTAGKIFEYTDTIGLKNHLLDLFGLYSQKNLIADSGDIERFSRKSLTGELGALLTKLIS
ncbi:MAG: glycosyltransferase family 4 protein [Bacteroidales bacterium]|nr:glycosyltransferase family 4 protein [Bacteroidales bacterium]